MAISVGLDCWLDGAQVGVVPRLVLEVDELLGLLQVH